MSDEKKDDKKSGNLSDLVKKVVTTGLSAAFMTEDAVKTVLADLPLPKEFLTGLLQNAKTTKEEFVKGVKNELRTYLEKINVHEQIDRILEDYDVEVNAKISFTKKKNKK